jgi:N utilization substance protein B
LDITQQNAIEVLAQWKEHGLPKKIKDGFSEQIILGVLEHRRQIDHLIKQYSDNWHLDRMSVIDRNILRMATFELLYCEEVPPKVTLNEAIDLGKQYGNEDSGSFINGILDRIQNVTVRKPLQPKTLLK